MKYFAKRVLTAEDNNVKFVLCLLDTLKVIGEISTAATWIKYGDVFDEDQIKLTYKFGTMKEGWKDIRMEARNKISGQLGMVRPHAPSFNSDTWEILYPLVEDTIIKIKCLTCNTFH